MDGAELNTSTNGSATEEPTTSIPQLTITTPDGASAGVTRPPLPPHKANPFSLPQLLSFARLLYTTKRTPTPPPLPDGHLAGARILVTAGNGGLGFALCRQLLRLGADLVVTTRTEEKGNIVKEILAREFPAGKVEALLCDATCIAAVLDIARSFTAPHSRLDGAILNWGMMPSVGPLETSVDGFNTCFQINTITPAILALLLLPILRASRDMYGIHTGLGSHPVLLFVNADGHSTAPITSDYRDLAHLSDRDLLRSFGARPFDDALDTSVRHGLYKDSKLVQLAWAQELANRITDVAVCAVSPGVCTTRMLELHPPKMLKALRLVARPPDDGARMILHALTGVHCTDGDEPSSVGCRAVSARETPWLMTAEGQHFTKRMWSAIWNVAEKAHPGIVLRAKLEIAVRPPVL
ncbi:hypothetical protein EDC01DRAFT_791246 [Geopyxis carbonaria]|nr:hypothetical protein EDC01DRAFT_791246 [Geopyxis carbonaria]